MVSIQPSTDGSSFLVLGNDVLQVGAPQLLSLSAGTPVWCLSADGQQLLQLTNGLELSTDTGNNTVTEEENEDEKRVVMDAYLTGYTKAMHQHGRDALEQLKAEERQIDDEVRLLKLRLGATACHKDLLLKQVQEVLEIELEIKNKLDSLSVQHAEAKDKIKAIASANRMSRKEVTKPKPRYVGRPTRERTQGAAEAHNNGAVTTHTNGTTTDTVQASRLVASATAKTRITAMCTARTSTDVLDVAQVSADGLVTGDGAYRFGSCLSTHKVQDCHAADDCSLAASLDGEVPRTGDLPNLNCSARVGAEEQLNARERVDIEERADIEERVDTEGVEILSGSGVGVDEPSPLYECKVCDYEFISEMNLQRHLELGKCRPRNYTARFKNSEMNSIRMRLEPVYECTVCKFQFVSQLCLDRHLRRNKCRPGKLVKRARMKSAVDCDPKVVFECTTCNFEFVSEVCLDRHLRLNKCRPGKMVSRLTWSQRTCMKLFQRKLKEEGVSSIDELEVIEENKDMMERGNSDVGQNVPSTCCSDEPASPDHAVERFDSEKRTCKSVYGTISIKRKLPASSSLSNTVVPSDHVYTCTTCNGHFMSDTDLQEHIKRGGCSEVACKYRAVIIGNNVSRTDLNNIALVRLNSSSLDSLNENVSCGVLKTDASFQQESNSPHELRPDASSALVDDANIIELLEFTDESDMHAINEATDSSGARNTVVKKYRIFQCNVCNFQFTAVDSLRKHLLRGTCRPGKLSSRPMKSRTGNGKTRPWLVSTVRPTSDVCEACGKTCSAEPDDATELLFPDVCRHCHEMFAKNTVDGSIDADNTNKMYTCLVCPWKFDFARALKVHLRLHTGYRPFLCSKCGQSFTTKNSEQLHVKYWHQYPVNERPLGCTLCSKRFLFKSGLDYHMRVHTGEKPFKCPLCTQTFASYFQVKLHNRVHTGQRPYVCTICGKTYRMSSGLQQHMYNHTGVRPVKCHLCFKGLKTKYAMRKHMRSHEREERRKVAGH